MRYVDVFQRQDGEPRWKARVYEDGRVETHVLELPVARLLGELSFVDPDTGRRKTEGSGLLRAIEAQLNSDFFETVRGSTEWQFVSTGLPDADASRPYAPELP
ncbi:MAG TPA: hypothetical protein VNN10_00325 [Dehalococcoidia bacterium]|nr:hypothetical protein [Dehalococcoidia bacterium]